MLSPEEQEPISAVAAFPSMAESFSRLTVLIKSLRSIRSMKPLLSNPVYRTWYCRSTASRYGFMYAPDPASLRVATIGGNIAEGAGGMRGVKYGVAKDHLLGLEIVLADGEIVAAWSKWKILSGDRCYRNFLRLRRHFWHHQQNSCQTHPLSESTRTMIGHFRRSAKCRHYRLQHHWSIHCSGNIGNYGPLHDTGS